MAINTPQNTLAKMLKKDPTRVMGGVLLAALMLGLIGGMGGYYVADRYDASLQPAPTNLSEPYQAQTSTEEAVIAAVESTAPSVVSVVATRDLPAIDEFFINEFGLPQFRQREGGSQEVSAGTGFVAGTNLIVTNRHVVEDTSVEYVAITSDGRHLEAEVIARDPVDDLAILRVNDLNLPAIPLADSDGIVIGQQVLSIGNALGELQNSVSLGVISGLGRTITAAGGRSGPEELREVIQTDAAINFGNSGGPLLNLRGEVVGVNVARASGAENIGFAVPINRVKNALRQAEETGVVRYPFLGVRYSIITEDNHEDFDVSVEYGALVHNGAQVGQPAVSPNSAADRAGIVVGDVILEMNGTRITSETPLNGLLSDLNVGDTISLTVLRDGVTRTLQATLGERP
ncbi:MAG: trypsin-like peptidase domain-containing protein [Candidatus Spechtbacterales bacterium]